MAWIALVLALIAAAAAPSAAQGTAASAPAAQAADAPRPWWERLTFYGDFRSRFEGFYQDDAETRQRGRFRLRVGLRAPIAEGLDFNLRLASGDAADVTSTNQSLTDFWNRKPINIDQASITYTPRRARALTLGAGKFGYPVTRTQMVWDDDVNWEGAYEQVSWTAAPVNLRVVAVQSPLSEVGVGDDVFMFGHYAQAGFRVGGHTVQLSLADYVFHNPDGLAVALDQRSAIRTQQTNALRRDASGRVVGYASGFNLVDAIGQVTFDTGRPQYPFAALVDYVVNTRAASDEDQGIWIVGSYGRAAAVNTYSASYTFARVERDAVVSAFNFSDMGPATNVLMNMISLSYMPKSRLNLDLNAIFTKRLEVAPGTSNPTLTRLQVDARISF